MSPLQGTPNRFGYQSQQLPDMGYVPMEFTGLL